MTVKRSDIAKNEFCLCGCGTRLKGAGRTGYHVGHYPRSSAHGLKMSRSHMGKHGSPHTDEWKKMMSERNSGRNNPRYGVKWSDEEKRKIGERTKAVPRTDEWKQNISRSKKGKLPYPNAIDNLRLKMNFKGNKLPEETKKKISISQRGKKIKPDVVDNFRKRVKGWWASGKFDGRVFPTRQKIGRRTDLGTALFRSSWEANFARVMNYWGIGWEYEPRRFDCGDIGTYSPDFRLETGIWVEVKGYDYPKGRIKIDTFTKLNPRERLVVIRGDFFKGLDPKIKRAIPEWE